MTKNKTHQNTTCNACNGQGIIIQKDTDDHPEPDEIIECIDCHATGKTIGNNLMSQDSQEA